VASRDPDRPPPVSVFSPEFLHLLARLDEPAEAGGTDLVSRTDHTGPWRLLALDHPQGGFGLFRCGEDPSTHPPLGAFADWHVALLFSAVVPTLALDPIFELGPTATAEGHPVWNRRSLAGHLSTFDPAVVAAAHTAAAIARAPLALAALLIASGPLGIERTAEILSQHYLSRRSVYGSRPAR
jgi:hypothetical protein